MKNILIACSLLFVFACDKRNEANTQITLTTTDISALTSNSVTTGGNITSSGGINITAKGVVWSTSNNPTILLSTKTNDAGTTGFTSNITGLNADTKYFVRAYATNQSGTYYGNEISFTTRAANSFGTVTSANGRVWLDRNLGASRVATNITDTSAYGDLYQWGRGADQHQSRKSITIATQSSTDVPGNANFILPNTPLTDWRSPANVNLWQGVNGINNPCPTGFRLPTEAEWNTELSSWTTKNADGAFASPLKLTVAGSREITINGAGTSGSYWSSTRSGDGSRYLNISSAGSFVLTHNRSYGGSIRCIKE
ncbi:MAG: hypothetical protein WBH12_03590 [Sediminibacterium sp.]